MQRSKLATAAAICGAVGLFDPAIGIALAHFGLTEPFTGFRLFLLGLATAIVGGLLGAGALYTTRAAAQRSGRELAYFSIAAALVAFGAVAIGNGPRGDTPAINDISTDLADPPAFPSDPSGRGRDMTYPLANPDLIRATASYRDLQPIRVARPRADVLREAEATARALDWSHVAVDPAAGTVTASDTSKLFRFVDDVVVRVRDDGTGGSVVDMRSKSRDGIGDIGANAARIRRFFAALPK